MAFSLDFSAQSSTDDVKKEAAKLFEEEDYSKAYKLYSQLVANYPKDPDLNYRLGVCMIFAEADKKKCLPYLKFAYSKPNETPKETKFYLGKAYHVNYLFDEAIKYYNEYKKVGSTSQQKKLMVDKEVKSCAYGKRLLSNLSDLEVKSKKELNEADYFRSYDLKDIGGKLLVKPDDFKTGADKKKKEKSVVYLPKNSDRVYFSSYGEGGDNKDIYYATKLPGGGFSKPQKVNGINSDYDEDYPFLHPNGTTLYFASKGHNSMGGYDIFKSTYIEATNSWSPPVNLEFPINSPDDDYLYVTDSLEKTAYFSTGRQSPPGKIDVLKINTERKPIDILALKGTVVKESADQSLKSKITVKNMDNGNIVGIYEAQDNGDYFMDLPNGAKLLYTVETPGLKTQSDKVGLPMVTTSKPLKQTISYDKGILKIINYFEEAPGDDSYLQYLKIIEQKAKLDVNEGQNKLNPTLVNNTNNNNAGNNGNNNPSIENDGGNNTATNNSTNTNTASIKSGTNTGVSNKQLADIAKKDAEDSQKEANQLKQDADDAFELGNQKKIEAEKKITDADNDIKNAQAITNEEEKKSALEKATAIKADGENDLLVANKILDYSKSLKEDANLKSKEAELNKQYAGELEKVSSGKNISKETLAKLDELQKQIDDVSKQKTTSGEIYNSIKNDIEEKEKQIAKIEKTNGDIKSNLDEINTEIKNGEDELAKTKKKKDKEAIENRIAEMKEDKDGKEKQIAGNNTELNKLKEELAGLNKQLDLANKIKNETIAVNTNTGSIASNTTAAGNNNTGTSEKINSKTLAEKYKDKIAVTDANSKSNIEEVNIQLKSYNKELDATIAKTKTDLTKAKNATTKQELTNEIKQLETAKKQNQQEIAANTKKIDELNKSAVASNNGSDPVIKPVNANNSKDAVNQLNTLNTQLGGNDYSNFDYNSYQNQQAQALKVEADAKINEAVAQQKKLKEFIETVKNQLQNSSTPVSSNTATPDQLHKEAEEHSIKAFDYRTQANTKTGSEKDDLIAKAKEEDAKANEKNLKAAEITANDNKTVFETNKENLKTLLDANKTNENESAEAKKLEQEADIAFKQAQSIREEANSLTNAGAKLGSLSNAEEKETEALNKLQEAITTLKKLTPAIALKTPVTSESNTGNQGNAGNNLDQVQTVNAGLNDLLNSKNTAYQKLFDANNLEIDQLQATIKNNQALIDKTPRLKSELVSATNKIIAAQTLKQNASVTTDNGKKLNDLTEATKKQIEALKQLNDIAKTVNESTNSTVANNNNANNTNGNKTNNTNDGGNNGNSNQGNENNTGNSNTNNSGANNTNNTGNNNQTANNTSTVTPDNNTGNSNPTNTVSVNNNTTTSTPTVVVNNNNNNTGNSITNNQGNPVSAAGGTIDVKELAKADTSAKQIADLLSTKKTTVKNPQVNTLLNKSLTELKNIEQEKKVLENEIKTASSNGSNETPAQLKTKSDNILTESEDLSVKAFDLKTLANTKTGKEKDSLTAEAKKLENASQTKKIEASTLTQKANDINLATNDNAINELISRLKKDNPTLAGELENKVNDIQTLKTQSKQLREEANAQNNTNAKLGALGNAEEKESETIIKQEELITELKKQYPDYVVKQVNGGNTSGEVPETLRQKQTQLNEKEFTELTNITNAYSLEYETSKNSVPETLTEEQKTIKQNADDLNAESKRLLIQSSTETNPAEKTKLLALAAKTGNAAVEQLNKITGNKPLANNTNPNNNNPRNNGNNNNSNNNNQGNNGNNNNTANNTNPRNNNNNPNNNNTSNNNNVNNSNPTNNNANVNGRGTVKIEGLEVTAGNAYSANKPIPIDSKVPDGLVFRVQIGAFKNQLPNNTFRGLSPVNGETTPNGYIRYTAGNFTKLENANGVKNDLRNLGYSDAFVVVYYNGKRISLSEALDILNKEGKTIDNNASQTAGINANANIPKATNTTQNPNVNAQDAVSITRELEQINGLLYTVQIGVYSKKVSRQQLFNLKPIYTEKLTNGLFRYTAGIYNNGDKIISDKNKVVGIGVKDAFVSAYLNGKRISFAEGKTKQLGDSTIKMEPENPIIFSDIITPAATNTTANVPVNNVPSNTPVANNTPTVQPFSNGVSSYPAATAENGVKPNEDGISFKVQIGAYSKQVPNDVAAKFLSIKTWPIENKAVNGLYIYNIGNFTEARFAKTLKEEAIRLGLNDAFITVYKDGQKLSGAEATQYLSR